jgi:tRNA-specific 2-thiouridylase
VGEHQGLAFYTIGQRKGLGLAAPQPLYVIHKDIEGNRLIIGPAEALGQHELAAHQTSYVGGAPPAHPIQVEIKIRYKAKPVTATLTPLPGNRAHLVLQTPLRDITPGQAVVFYQGEQTLGGGIITEEASA